jgi:hypothetical protein
MIFLENMRTVQLRVWINVSFDVKKCNMKVSYKIFNLFLQTVSEILWSDIIPLFNAHCY